MIPFFFRVHRNHHSSLTSSFVVMETKPFRKRSSGASWCRWVHLGHRARDTGLWDARGGTAHTQRAGQESSRLCSPLVRWSLSSTEPSHLARLGERPRAAPPAYGGGGRRGQAAPSTLCRAPAASQDTRARRSSKHLSRLEEPSRMWCCLQPRATIPSWNWPAQGLSSGISLY